MKLKRTSVIILALVMMLTLSQAAFAKNTAGVVLGYNNGRFMALGEWTTTTTSASELLVAAGIVFGGGSSIAIPAEVAWRYDFYRLTLGNTSLGYLAFGAKVKANAYITFGTGGDAAISAGLGLYGNWFINPRWSVGTNFTILNFEIMPVFHFGVPLSNITNVTYNISSSLALKLEFGYNRFRVDKNNYHVGLGAAFTF